MMIKTKMMKMAQVLMLLLLVAFLFITPHLSSSLRHTTIYFIINLLIIALGAEAGLLKAFSNPLDHHQYHQDKKPLSTSYVDHTQSINEGENKQFNAPGFLQMSQVPVPSEPSEVLIKEYEGEKKKVVKKSKSEKIVKMEIKAVVKKCPSMPSLFFIGGGDGDEAEAEAEAEEEEEVLVGGDLSGQELYTKAEMFIGNFYKQLKMQREDSWKKIHGFYQRAF